MDHSVAPVALSVGGRFTWAHFSMEIMRLGSDADRRDQKSDMPCNTALHPIGRRSRMGYRGGKMFYDPDNTPRQDLSTAFPLCVIGAAIIGIVVYLIILACFINTPGNRERVFNPPSGAVNDSGVQPSARAESFLLIKKYSSHQE